MSRDQMFDTDWRLKNLNQIQNTDNEVYKFILREKSPCLLGKTLIDFCLVMSNIDKPQSVHFELIKKQNT